MRTRRSGAAETKPSSKKAIQRTAARKAIARRTPPVDGGPSPKPRIFGVSFASVYPLYLQKAERRGRTKEEVDEILQWLTGYSGEQLGRATAAKVSLEAFFAGAPQMNPNAGRITGVVCGVRVEDVADPLMRRIRYLDKLIDELAKGKTMASILRQ